MTATVLAAEAVLVGGYGVYLAVETAMAPATEPVAAAVLAVMVLGLAAALAAMAASVMRGRRWARVPALVWQMLQASVAVPALSTSRWPLGVVLLALCVLGGLGLLRLGESDAAGGPADGGPADGGPADGATAVPRA